MKLKRKALILLTIYMFVVLVCSLIPFYLSGPALDKLNTMGCICLFELVLFCWFSKKLHGKLLNFATVFMIILYIFHFGQLMLYTFLIDIYSHIRFLLLMTPESAFHGFQYMNLAFNALCVGMLLPGAKGDADIIKQRAQLRNQRYDFEKVAKDIIFVTFPVKIFIDVASLYITLTSGGEAARSWVNTFPNVFLYYGKISLVGFALLLLVYKNRPSLQKKVFLFIELYILVMMISGIRSENVGYLCVFAFLYFACREKRISSPALLLYAVIGIVVLAFVVTVGEFRTYSSKSADAFFALFKVNLTEKNVILSLIDTCGDTGYTAQSVINNWLPRYGPSYGNSYYLGLFAIIPNVPVILTFPGTITAASSFPLRLQEAGVLSNSYTNIGGSLLGELFFNFGLYGAVIAALLLGVLLGQVSYKCKYYIEKNNYYGMIWIAPVMFAVTYWVRDYFGGEIREIVWGPLVSLLVINIFKRYKTYPND